MSSALCHVGNYDMSQPLHCLLPGPASPVPAQQTGFPGSWVPARFHRWEVLEGDGEVGGKERPGYLASFSQQLQLVHLSLLWTLPRASHLDPRGKTPSLQVRTCPPVALINPYGVPCLCLTTPCLASHQFCHLHHLFPAFKFLIVFCFS